MKAQATLDFHRDIMERQLNALEENRRLDKHELWSIAQKLYDMYYKDKVPIEELNEYKPKHEHK